MKMNYQIFWIQLFPWKEGREEKLTLKFYILKSLTKNGFEKKKDLIFLKFRFELHCM